MTGEFELSKCTILKHAAKEPVCPLAAYLTVVLVSLTQLRFLLSELTALISNPSDTVNLLNLIKISCAIKI